MTFSEATIALPALAEPFWKQASLNAVGPLITVIFGGLLITSLIRWLDVRAAERRRQEEQDHSMLRQEEDRRRSELRVEEDRRRAETDRNYRTCLDLMQAAHGFYFRLAEKTRVEEYEGKIDLGSLPEHYENFRIESRVLEEQLRVYFPDGRARWLWHGAVDMLSVRYYLLAHPGPRLADMIEAQSAHSADAKIPESVRSLFLGPSRFSLDDRILFHNTVMEAFERMLALAINLVAHGEMDPDGVSPVALDFRPKTPTKHAESTG